MRLTAAVPVTRTSPAAAPQSPTASAVPTHRCPGRPTAASPRTRRSPRAAPVQPRPSSASGRRADCRRGARQRRTRDGRGAARGNRGRAGRGRRRGGRVATERTCAGCGRKAQAELLRFAAVDGRLTPGRTLPAGASTRATTCRASNRRSPGGDFSRVLRRTVAVEPELARLYTDADG